MSFKLDEMERAIKSIKIYELLLYDLELNFNKGMNISYHGTGFNSFVPSEILLSENFKEAIIKELKEIIETLRSRYDIEN